MAEEFSLISWMIENVLAPQCGPGTGRVYQPPAFAKHAKSHAMIIVDPEENPVGAPLKMCKARENRERLYLEARLLWEQAFGK